VAKNFHGKKDTQLSDLLQTKDPKDQVKRVQELIQRVQSPVIDVIIRADPRFQSVEVIIIGGNINFESAYMILDRAREWLRQRELKEVTKPGQVIEPNPEQLVALQTALQQRPPSTTQTVPEPVPVEAATNG